MPRLFHVESRVPTAELHVMSDGKAVKPKREEEEEAGGVDVPALLGKTILLAWILFSAYTIRLHAVNVYGRVIHEFDPWFNFRATDYLVNHGAKAFWNWYDTEAWYPLGRPVGTTIYAGLQFTSAYIFYALEALGTPMSLNDVCVFVPAWFGPITTLFVFGMAYEASFSSTAALGAAFFMSVTPAHLMRSVAGGFDNEGIAVAAICGTFYFWMRSIRTEGSWPWAFATAAMYIYMVAAWGGYVFVLNMVIYGCMCTCVCVCVCVCVYVYLYICISIYLTTNQSIKQYT